MTAFPDLTPIPNRLTRPDTIDDDADAFFPKLPTWAQAAIDLASNMSAYSLGGAYAVPYTYRAGTSFNGTANTLCFFDGGGAAGNAAASTTVRVDSLVGGADMTALLLSMGASTSPIKGTLRIVKQGDPSKWAVFNISGYVQSTGYFSFSVGSIAYSSATPFADYDLVMLQFTRAGDIGAAGSLTPTLWVRDQKSSGVAGGASVAGVQARTLNTVVLNTIGGAILSGGQVTLPAGTYRIDAAAQASGGASLGGNQLYLYNVTDAATTVLGQSACSIGTGAGNMLALIKKGQFSIAATKTFELRHWTSGAVASNGLGLASSSSQGEIYADMFIEKVA